MGKRMSFKHTLISVGCLLIFSMTVYAQEQINEHLQFLTPYLGKTWKGVFVDSTATKPLYDISTWERALNGQAVRSLHSVNDGEYGGETIIYWDKVKQTVVYYYFTTAGFYTNGIMRVAGDKIVSHEYVTGNQNNISEVRSTTYISPDGKMYAEAEFMQNGKWIPGHKIIYSEDITAKVIFK